MRDYVQDNKISKRVDMSKQQRRQQYIIKNTRNFHLYVYTHTRNNQTSLILEILLFIYPTGVKSKINLLDRY